MNFKSMFVYYFYFSFFFFFFFFSFFYYIFIIILKKKLNEFIRLEYHDPSKIKIIFDCNKERVEFELGCSKEKMSRLSDFVLRTSSDVPFKSKTGQLKVATLSKPTAQAAKQLQTNKKVRVKSILFWQKKKIKSIFYHDF